MLPYCDNKAAIKLTASVSFAILSFVLFKTSCRDTEIIILYWLAQNPRVIFNYLVLVGHFDGLAKVFVYLLQVSLCPCLLPVFP